MRNLENFHMKKCKQIGIKGCVIIDRKSCDMQVFGRFLQVGNSKAKMSNSLKNEINNFSILISNILSKTQNEPI